MIFLFKWVLFKLQPLMFRGLQEFVLFAQICRKNLKLRTIEEVGFLGTPDGKNVEFMVRNCLADASWWANEQKRWPCFLLNHQQMSNWVGVKALASCGWKCFTPETLNHWFLNSYGSSSSRFISGQGLALYDGAQQLVMVLDFNCVPGGSARIPMSNETKAWLFRVCRG